MNELELTGAVINVIMLESQNIPLKYAHLATYCNNTMAVAWAYKLQNSKLVVVDYLLCFLGL